MRVGTQLLNKIIQVGFSRIEYKCLRIEACVQQFFICAKPNIVLTEKEKHVYQRAINMGKALKPHFI